MYSNSGLSTKLVCLLFSTSFFNIVRPAPYSPASGKHNANIQIPHIFGRTKSEPKIKTKQLESTK